MSEKTLEKWERENISILTSKEMGAWLGRRDDRLLERIKADIEKKANSGQWSEAVVYGMVKAIKIVEGYKAGREWEEDD